MLLFLGLVFLTIIACQGSREDPAHPQDVMAPSLPHGKILINGNAALDAFFAGNGTTGSESNPHILQNFEINAGGDCIALYNTNKHVIIQDCILFDSGSGIYLENCQNVDIIGCSIFSNNYGVFLSQSTYNTIQGNNITQNANGGVCLYTASNFNSITTNNITRSGRKGIAVLSAHNTTIRDNLISSNGPVEDQCGILLRASMNTTISGNDICNNIAFGITFDTSNNNTIYDNLLQNNSQYGINMINSNYNTFLGNDMIDNDNWDANTNYWDNGTRGNFWWDYYWTRTTAGHDGVVWNETITVNGGGQDHCALVYPSHPFNYNYPLLIDGNTRLYYFPFKTGNGTAASPYIIENLVIQKTPPGNCIYLRIVDKHVIIRNCTLSGATGGGDAGIELFSCQNVNITNCTMVNNNYGIYFATASNNSASYNTISHNIGAGICSINGMGNVMSHNTILNNTAVGIRVVSPDNLILENFIFNNYNGILVDSSTTGIII
nr:right-handed parallel beta-helix repeat-containing protein [Candidatus Sigynarchaeota archaeon]